MRKILFIDSVHEVLHQRLESAGFACEMHHTAAREELLLIAKNYFGLVVRSRISIDKEFLDAASSLEFIARSGSGLENIDVKYAQSKRIEIFNSPEGNRDAVGEHAIGMLLMLMNNLHRADVEVRNGLWRREENRGHEIAGKTIGIIGYGVMGSGFAEKLSGFGCNIIAHDKYKKGFSSSRVKEVSLEEIFRETDILSIHLPFTDETKYYVNEEFVSRFHRPIYFINTSRGKIVETSALVSALKNGKVKGACLDVLEHEKSSLEGLESDALSNDLKFILKSDSVVLSPHIAGWTNESYFKLSDVLADKILESVKCK
ncbi:MAG: NAD(P)-dependent oxidoreductase [Flavobacteriales bacterium]|nr:NAD(P)-dependent oxidoreductase [Flavobacteriales bacterium]